MVSSPRRIHTEPWCRSCCTRHDPDRRCPGEMLATGPERFGWRAAVSTPYGREVMGVLVAPVGPRWRARILTYPKILWMVPGGGGSIKFIGASPGEAESQAVDFILEHIKLRGFRIMQESPKVESGPIDREQTSEVARSEDVKSSERTLKILPIHFGVGEPDTEATTGDLSESGVFIATDTTLAVGTPIRMCLEIEGCTIPLRGEVVWKRDEAHNGRPAGMGIELVEPPSLYTRFVRDLD